MIHQIRDITIPQNKRKDLNEKIIHVIDNNLTEKYGITSSDVYNTYTGDGGLHGLSFNDYDSFHAFTEAKKEHENGQFFTPHNVCKFLIDCIKPSPHDLIADLTAGMGNFFNFIPNQNNVYANEIDIKAYKVMKYLYPDIHMTADDIRNYDPGVSFDLILGNPPFNLKWKVGKDEYLSQLYYVVKAHELLKPAGMLAMIVPFSFLADEFSDGGMISEVNSRYNFIYQAALPHDVFKSVGVENFKTKIMFFQKKSEQLTHVKPFSTDIHKIELNTAMSESIHTKYIEPIVTEKEKIKSKLFLEQIQSNNDNYEFSSKVKKYLYDIKRNPKINNNYAQCTEYVNRYYTQAKPEGMKYDEWEKVRLTKNKVLSYLKRIIKNQHIKEMDSIKLVKTNYGLKLKGYSHKNKLYLSKFTGIKEISFNDMIIQGSYPFEDQTYKKLTDSKTKQYEKQSQQFINMDLDPKVKSFLDELVITDHETAEQIKLNEIQKADTNKILQKQYGFIQWGQGSGKSISGIANLQYRLKYNNIRNVFIVSAAIAINNTWQTILQNYKMDYIRINNLSDISNIKHGQIVIITLNLLAKYQKQMRKYIKIQSNKVALILDEADNISSPVSKRTKAVLSVFRKVKYKTLMTGTMTRNTIAEAATQFELLYNNSVNMLSESKYIYKPDKMDKAKLNQTANDCYMKPIPAYHKGYRLFSESHIPEKITVFGIGQHTQDIYNADTLKKLIDKTIITRTFEEVRGEKIYKIIQNTSQFNSAEYDLYKKVIEEFYSMKHLFKSTGNLRKDRMLEILNQLNLMLKVCAAPQTIREYRSTQTPSKYIDVMNKIADWDSEHIAIGVRHIKTVNAYASAIRSRFSDRPLFIITGDKVTLNKRKEIIENLKASENGILLSTQQSLSSSMNIGFVNKVIIPELSWNDATMSQYFFRFIRYNSEDKKEVHFFTYENSIESNLLGLILTKEKLNMFMKNQDIDDEELYDKFGVHFNLLDMLMTKEKDEEGRAQIRWGKQNIMS
ncbi:N-6 DNA methylase [Paenibacillus sp. JSM ZJ436]|uniref:N-6 DNA methylase n=1 Tax=Paenibacillus sp. JSM ZJ436 TaxID=3376190 RepID=UPI0037BB661F